MTRDELDALDSIDLGHTKPPRMTPPDVEAIARGLSKVQREALLNHPSRQSRVLIRPGLAFWGQRPGKRWPEIKLRALSFQVRDHLKGLPDE